MRGDYVRILRYVAYITVRSISNAVEEQKHSLAGIAIEKLCIEYNRAARNKLIGYVGKTGVTTGYHLHFAIRKYNEETEKWDHVDPAKYINFN